MRARNDPQAAILDSGIIHRNPCTGKRAVTGWNVKLILVPGLPRLARRFDKQHRLHAFHVRANYGGQHISDAGMRQHVVHASR